MPDIISRVPAYQENYKLVLWYLVKHTDVVYMAAGRSLPTPGFDKQ